MTVQGKEQFWDELGSLSSNLLSEYAKVLVLFRSPISENSLFRSTPVFYFKSLA